MRPGTVYLPQPVNYLFHKRGIGDMICAFKVTKTIRHKWPHVRPILWVPDFVVGLGRHMLKSEMYDDNVQIFGWSEMEEKYDNTIPKKSFRGGTINSWRVPLMKHTYLWMADYYPLEEGELDYLPFDLTDCDISRFDLPRDYACIAVTHNAANKEFLSRHVRKLIGYFKRKGILPVLLGNTVQEYTNEGKTFKTQYAGKTSFLGGHSLVNKTNLVEAGAIMAEAKAVVGIDGGLIHLAACTSTPIVAGFTVVDPRLFTPTRKGVFGRDFYSVVPERTLGCRLCHSQVNFVNHEDVFSCFYKDNKCLDHMEAEKFIRHLDKFL